MNVGKVIVRTSDFRLAYRLLAGLKARHVRCAHLEQDAFASFGIGLVGPPKRLKPLQTLSESVPHWNRLIPPLNALRFVAKGGVIKELTFGIDPGPRPGLAWVETVVFLERHSSNRWTQPIDRICSLSNDIGHTSLTVRIGDGSRTISNRLANVCLARGLKVERVDERRTSEVYSEISTMHPRTNRSNERGTCHSKTSGQPYAGRSERSAEIESQDVRGSGNDFTTIGSGGCSGSPFNGRSHWTATPATELLSSSLLPMLPLVLRVCSSVPPISTRFRPFVPLVTIALLYSQSIQWW